MAAVIFAKDFFPAISRLQPNEQAQVIQFVTQFQQNPAHPGISLERVKNSDDGVWSGRVTQDLRAILYKDGDTWAILHADHHDPAYAWAERRQIGPHSVDEVQDLNAAELRFLRGLAIGRLENFMVVGDAGQRIYPGGFSLRALGIEVRGRSHILRINYRTTEQIRRAADALLGAESDDLDSGTERRDQTRSLLSGPEPALRGYQSWAEELDGAAAQVLDWLRSGLAPSEIAIFVRTNQLAEELEARLGGERIEVLRLQRDVSLNDPGVRIGSMHRAKGLEFKAVLVAGAGSAYLPHPRSLANVRDPKDREELIDQERRLLYVAMTRARDELALTWSGEGSGFLDKVGVGERG